jgi:hypothetical protein
MALTSLSELDQYKAAPFPPGYPDDTRTFYSPVVIASVTFSKKPTGYFFSSGLP